MGFRDERKSSKHKPQVRVTISTTTTDHAGDLSLVSEAYEMSFVASTRSVSHWENGLSNELVLLIIDQSLLPKTTSANALDMSLRARMAWNSNSPVFVSLSAVFLAYLVSSSSVMDTNGL